MKFDKLFHDPRWIELCKTTYEKIIADKIITDEEWDYLFDLHKSLTGQINDNRDEVLNDIRTVAYTKIRYKK